MREPEVGRVLVASLHEAIAEHLPTRLTFYESFLHPEGLRAGAIGVAPLMAVLSFLRLEGAEYAPIVTRAGNCAAEWTIESMSPFERRAMVSAPAWLRTRLVLRLASRMVRESAGRTGASWRLRQGVAEIELHDSLFCTVRTRVAAPLCGFYIAVYERLFESFDLAGARAVADCRATNAGAPACRLTVTLASALGATDKESAA